VNETNTFRAWTKVNDLRPALPIYLSESWDQTLLFQRVRANDRGWVEFWSLIMAPISKKVNVFHVSTQALLLSLTINIK
jgi:hypothetical protein